MASVRDPFFTVFSVGAFVLLGMFPPNSLDKGNAGGVF